LFFRRFQTFAPGSAEGTGRRGGGEEGKLGLQPQREKKSASFPPLQAESLLSRRKRVCQPPAWTVRARTAPALNLFSH